MRYALLLQGTAGPNRPMIIAARDRDHAREKLHRWNATSRAYDDRPSVINWPRALALLICEDNIQ